MIRESFFEHNDFFGILLYTFLFLPREASFWHYSTLFGIILYLYDISTSAMQMKQHEGDDDASAELISREMLRLFCAKLSSR